MSTDQHAGSDAAKLAQGNTFEDVGHDTSSAAIRLAQEVKQNISSPQRPLKDITDEFTTACNVLRAGQLVKDEYFTLFESVGALEIMDAKMDTGMMSTVKEPQSDPGAVLSTTEMIWVMDELLRLEIAWLEDYPLSQTTFTSIHIDRILDSENKYPHPFELRPQDVRPNLTNKVLHPYCVALIKCNAMVLELVRSQGFYEEEDFISHTFGRDLLPDISNEEVLTKLEDAAKWATQHLPDSTAIEVRLAFRITFMRSIFGQVNGWQDLSVMLTNSIEVTHDTGTPAIACFTESVLSHLATSTPPRPALKTTWKEACIRWKKLFSDVLAAMYLTSHWVRSSPASLQRAMWTFAARRPITYPRSVIQDIMFVEGKIADDLSHLDLLLTDIRELILPGHSLTDPDSYMVEAVADPRHKCSRMMETFLDGSLDHYLELYRMICQNRARIRRDLTKAIIVWDNLETGLAIKTDTEIAAITPISMDGRIFKPLQSWTRYYKLKIMADTVLLGMETDIYLPDELAHMYWYLEKLVRERDEVVLDVEEFTADRADQLGRIGSRRHQEECLHALTWYSVLESEILIVSELAHALNELYAVLMHVGLIKAPSRTFAATELLHEARMKIYLGIANPKPPTVADFLQARTLKQPIDKVLGSIEQGIRVVKGELNELKDTPAGTAKYIGSEEHWKAEVKKLQATCVALQVAVTQLKSVPTSTKDWTQHLIMTIPAPEKRYHECWIVPQIKQKKR